MPLHDHVRALGDVEAPLELEAPALDLLELLHEVERIHHDAVAYDAVLAFVQDSGRHEVQNVLLVADHHGVARVRAALEPHDYIRLLGEEVDDLALAFIAPLGANEYSIHSWRILYQIAPER